MRQRGERLERPCARLYETGRMRRVHLRGHDNIRKRLLVHAGGLNLGLLMRTRFGMGTPRGLQGRAAALFATLLWLLWHPVTGLQPDLRQKGVADYLDRLTQSSARTRNHSYGRKGLLPRAASPLEA